MTREQFIHSLRRELRKLPPEEVVAATEYYEEYFDEALGGEPGDPGAEARLIEELGSPKTVASQIKSEYASRVLAGDETTLKYKPTVGNKISAFWWVLLGVLAVPVGLPLAIAGAAVIFALLIAVFAVIISLYAAAAGILAGALGALFLGVISIGASFATALMSLGTGIALAALAVLLGLGLTILVKMLIQVPVNLAHRSRERRGIES